MRYHLEMEVQRNLDAGLPPREARAAARRRFGGFDQLRERSRDQWSFVGLELWVKDLRFALRSLARSPKVTALAVSSLALAMGLGATVFSLVDPLLFRPLPLSEPQRLVDLHETLTETAAGLKPLLTNVSYADFRHWQARNRVFSDLAVFVARQDTCETSAQTVVLEGARVSAGLFRLLRVPPMLGRDFSDQDEQYDAPAVALLGHAVWERCFGADPAIIGRSVVVNARPHKVVGVMPAGFGFPDFAEIWTPVIVRSPEDTHGQHPFRCIARLRPGVTMESARGELAALSAAIARERPRTNAHLAARLDPFDHVFQAFGTPSWMLLGAVALVNLVACINVASLLLARSLSRQREFAIRAAVGASRWRASRQVLLECLMVSAVAGLLGFLLSFAGSEAVLSLVPGDVPYYLHFAIGPRVLGFAGGMVLVACLVSGVVPAWLAARSDLQAAIKEAGLGSESGRRPGRWRGFLVAAETAGAVALLSGTGLMIQTLRNLERANPGFDARPVSGFHILSLPASRYGTAAQQAGFFDLVRTRLAALPGVEAVAIAAPVPLEPLAGSQSSNRFVVEGRAPLRPEEESRAEFATVSPGYFDTLTIPLVLGRDFAATDDAAAPPVVIIDTAFAQQVFRGENPLGQRLQVDVAAADGGQPWREIVGVVATVKRYTIREEEDRPGFFLPLVQCPRPRVSVLLRATGGNAAALMQSVRQAMHEIDGAVAVYRPFSLQESIARSLLLNRIVGGVLAVFSGFALLLAATGIAGVTAFTVAQRTHEIGIRLALGAAPAGVFRMAVVQSMRPVGVGLLAGLCASLALSRMWSHELYGVDRNDPVTLAVCAVLLGLVALVACSFPARAATRVDPLAVLRTE